MSIYFIEKKKVAQNCFHSYCRILERITYKLLKINIFSRSNAELFFQKQNKEANRRSLKKEKIKIKR